MGFAMMAAPPPAQALSSIDGQWTVVHGGTGQLSLNADGTYTSTCEVYPNYEDAWCPAPSGTFQYSTMSTASVTFNGSDGSTHSYRVSGLVSSPDTITSMFGSRTYSPLVMKPGTSSPARNGVAPVPRSLDGASAQRSSTMRPVTSFTPPAHTT